MGVHRRLTRSGGRIRWVIALDTRDRAQVFVNGPNIVVREVLVVGPGHDRAGRVGHVQVSEEPVGNSAGLSPPAVCEPNTNPIRLFA